MNWVEGKSTWGLVKDAEVVSVEKTDTGLKAVYKTKHMIIDVERVLDGGILTERYSFRSGIGCDIFMRRGETGDIRDLQRQLRQGVGLHDKALSRAHLVRRRGILRRGETYGTVRKLSRSRPDKRQSSTPTASSATSPSGATTAGTSYFTRLRSICVHLRQ